MLDDFRAAIRSFRHRRGVAITVVVTLALGIGANAAIFSAVDAALLKPLPYPAADRLVSVHELNRGLRQATQLVAPVRLEEWNGQNRTFAGIAGSYFENMTDTTGALPERVEGMRTSPRFFAVLGVTPALGRTPTSEEERFGGPAAAVLSDPFWRRRFNADPNVVGRTLVLSGVSRTIVGIMPPSFRYPAATTDAWIPAQMSPALGRERRARFYTAIGRLNPAVTVAQAELDLTAVQARLGEQFPATDKGWGASLVPLREEQVAGIRRSLWFLFGAVALVLLAACGNVACLMLAEATRREPEIAIRFALGASRSVVVRQLLVEGLVLSATGAGLGLVLSSWSTSLLRQAGSQLPQMQELHVDGRLVLFTLTLSALTTMLFALAPALRATRGAPAGALARGGRGRVGGSHLLQRLLVVAQIALAVVLLAGAGLLVRSFVRLQQVSPGFEPNDVLTFRMSASWSERPDAVVARQTRTIARLQAIPGVEAAAVSQALPAGLAIPPGELHVVGRDPGEKTFAQGRAVSAGYFRTLRIPILRGDTCDGEQAALMMSKALVTRSFVDRFFPDVDPIGHEITAPGFPPGHVMTIVGVVGDVRENGVLNAPEPVVYWCGYSAYWPDPHFLVRTSPARQAAVPTIRTALLEIEPTRAMYAVHPLAETLSLSVFQQRLNTVLLTVFATMALALSGMGLYGVMSQLVAARRREFGVRMALGARPSHVASSVASQAAWITGAGIAGGLIGALGLAGFMAAMVFDVRPRDPLTFAAVPIVLAVVAAVAALVPVWRAARVDPMQVLRDE
jgi:putative ABC transport system permease protein